MLLGHVEPDFPYISDAATYSPESCVFGQLMNSGTVLCEFMLINVYINLNCLAFLYTNEQKTCFRFHLPLTISFVLLFVQLPYFQVALMS